MLKSSSPYVIQNAMKTLLRNTTLLLLMACLPYGSILTCQTIIWQETFDDLPNGTTVDTGPTAWVAYQNAGAPNGGAGMRPTGATFSVDNGTLLARNVVVAPGTATRTIGAETGLNQNWVVWESELIDISSGVTGIRIFAEVSSATTAELEPMDYIRLMYSVDGGAFQSFALNGLVRGDFGNLISASDCNPVIFGNSLRVRLEIANTTVNEFYRIDNITVVDAAMPSISLAGITHRSNVAAGNWNATGTWDVGTVPGNASIVEVTCGCVVRVTTNQNVRAVVVQPGGVLVWTVNDRTLTFTNGADTALVINTGAALGETILGGGFGGVNNSRMVFQGNTATLIQNNSSIANIDIFEITGNKDVAIRGIGVFEPRNVRFNNTGATIQIRNFSTVLTDFLQRSAASGTPRFINEANATLRLRGTNDSTIQDAVELEANAAGNTVIYERAANQWVHRPSLGTYHHLIFRASGIKNTDPKWGGPTAQTIVVNGDLRIEGAARLDVDAGDDDIELYGNWINTSNQADPFIQGSNNETVSFSGTANQTITRTGGPETFRRFVIDKSAGHVTLNSIVEVSGVATFTNGIVNSSAANLFRFLAGSSVGAVSNTSHVNGPVAKIGNTAFVFPTGSGARYAGIGISAPDATSDAFTAQYIGVAPPNSGSVAAPLIAVSEVEHWSLNQTNVGKTSGPDALNVSLHWLNGTFSGISDLTDLFVAYNNAGTWTTLGASGTSGTLAAGSVTSATGFNFAGGPFLLTFSSEIVPLPVEWMGLQATPVGQQVAVTWQTTNEQNNAGFWVERSNDGFAFTTLGFVSATETPTSLNAYQFDDRQPVRGRNYYRLVQQDLDGRTSQSNVVEVVFGPTDQALTLRPYPNPTTQFLYLGGLEAAGDIRWSLLDAAGRTIANGKLENTSQAIDIQSLHLSPGVYVVRAEHAGGTSVARFLTN
jgi:hypothetical protein